ncbi:MAG: hypothetical protein J1E62_09275 [Lachnospiraceae bacterium]|nr:hypothetical protein [Lachnospiraceae bacterium]
MKGYDEFKKELQKEVKKRLYDDREVRIRRINKLNEGEKEVISIMESDDIKTFCSDCFLDGIFEEYQKGMPLEEIAAALVRENNKEQVGNYAMEAAKRICLDDLDDVENVKERLYFRMINTDRNTELLEDMPHFDYFDLSMVFYLMMDRGDSGLLSMRITDRMLREWGITKEYLRETAMENTERILPGKRAWLEDVLEDYMEDADTLTEEIKEFREQKDNEKPVSLMVATNETGVNGFGVIFYPEYLKKTAEILNDNLYILPSSIHEALLYPEGEGCESGEMLRMVRAVNKECVASDDYLSDHVYYYDRAADRIEMITEQEG